MTIYNQKPYLLQPVFNFDELKNVVIKSYPNNIPSQMITVYCGYVSGDGLGGIYYYDPNSNSEENNNVIKPNNYDGRWLNYNQISGPSDYGSFVVSPDGITYGWYTPVVTDVFNLYDLVFDNDGKIVVV